ncbi:hypothetical protein [Streptomyces mangrovisoli]|uniref:Uncharacterized protein n=1 Tax=Streptomyces mangrovisoli TaxID=1428628 RepID=A0A1J4NYP5_9ACTN|nr:hypothetical protein [Streptomyces mangrovisoli]OIJ67607.1 hypothetical protein WN71_012340 [Streptomyces mangrovisoli]
MPEHVSIIQPVGVVFLALATAIWVTGLSRVARRYRHGDAPRRPAGLTPGQELPALPQPRQSGPHLEAVELTPAEQDAFAGLVRQLADGR